MICNERFGGDFRAIFGCGGLMRSIDIQKKLARAGIEIRNVFREEFGVDFVVEVGSIVPELSMLSLSDEESLREARKTLSNYFSPENKKQFTAVYEHVRACRDVLTDKDLRTWLDFFEPDNYRKN